MRVVGGVVYHQATPQSGSRARANDSHPCASAVVPLALPRHMDARWCSASRANAVTGRRGTGTGYQAETDARPPAGLRKRAAAGAALSLPAGRRMALSRRA
jgi:hypothetical protein